MTYITLDLEEGFLTMPLILTEDMNADMTSLS